MRNTSRVGIAAAAVLAACGAAVATAGSASAGTVVGIQFEHSNYGGATYTHSVTTNGYACTQTVGDVDVQFPTFPSSWNDEISSFRGYTNCASKNYEHSYYGGAAYGYYIYSSNLGVLNDETSSVRYS